MYILEGRLKECEKSFLIDTFCISFYETPLLNVICLLNELRYILCKYVVVICHEATEKQQNRTIYISLILLFLKLKGLHFYMKINIC